MLITIYIYTSFVYQTDTNNYWYIYTNFVYEIDDKAVDTYTSFVDQNDDKVDDETFKCVNCSLRHWTCPLTRYDPLRSKTAIIRVAAAA